MDQVALVDRRIDDGRKLVLQLARDGFQVTAAFWLKAPEDAWWYLFIASKVVDQIGPGKAYRALQSSLEHLPGTSISLADIKLIGVDDNPITASVRKVQQQGGGKGPLHFRGGQLGNLTIDEAYLYPLLARPKRGPIPLGKRKLKTAVERISRMDELGAPLSPQESLAMEQIVASGISPAQADYWVRKKREEKGTPIPAGTVVNAQVVGFEDDANPLLLVEASDGTQGLTFNNNTEPV